MQGRVSGGGAAGLAGVLTKREESETIMTGTVKWFNEKKGYGFITPDDGAADVFVHHTDLEGKGFKSLVEGQSVEYRVAQGKKGPKAAGVRVLDKAEG